MAAILRKGPGRGGGQIYSLRGRNFPRTDLGWTRGRYYVIDSERARRALEPQLGRRPMTPRLAGGGIRGD